MLKNLIIGAAALLLSTVVTLQPVFATVTHPNYNWNSVKDHIGFCESKGNYKARNRHSTASGKYQFLNTTWASRYGVKRAYLATAAQQEQAAVELHAKKGLQPWRSSRRCWERRMTNT